MKLDPDMMRSANGIHDEFDLYFARAALEELDTEAEWRRGSLPNSPALEVTQHAETRDGRPRRTASCKIPRNRRKGGSVSPRPPSRSSPSKAVLSPQYQVASHFGNGVKDQFSNPSDSGLMVPSQLRDFKCHSAPHSRSSSWKKMRRPRSTKDLYELEGQGRPRTGSVPLEESISARLEQLRLLQADDCCVVRNFTISSKGLVNRGDSFKRKSISVASDGGSNDSSHGDTDPNIPANLSVHSEESSSVSIFRVLMVGAQGVGKTALIQQFMTSEYMGALETSYDDDFEKTVSVLLDGEETMVDFYDLPAKEDYKTVENVDAYVLVYSITDDTSYRHVLDIMEEIRQDTQRHPAMILVANKGDLVRSRLISDEEGKRACQFFDSKYIEVSAALNHKVDELLVGVVSQIRLQPRREEKRRKRMSLATEKDIGCATGAKGIIHKLFKKQHGRRLVTSKSCDNLLVI